MENEQMSKLKMAQIKLDVLEPFYSKLDKEVESIREEFTKTGEQRIKRNWSDGNGEEMYNEDGSPVMEDVYGYVEKSNLSEEDNYRLDVLNLIRTKLDEVLTYIPKEDIRYVR